MKKIKNGAVDFVANRLGNYKSTLAGVGLIATGIGSILSGITSDPVNHEIVWAGVASISVGFSATLKRKPEEK